MSTLLQEIEALIKTTQELPNNISVWQHYDVMPGFTSGGLGKDAPYQEIQEPDPKLNSDSDNSVSTTADLLNSDSNKYKRYGNYTSVFTGLSKSLQR